jgi:hypothetical protein
LLALKGSPLGVGTDIGGFVVIEQNVQFRVLTVLIDLCGFQAPFAACMLFALHMRDFHTREPEIQQKAVSLVLTLFLAIHHPS